MQWKWKWSRSCRASQLTSCKNFEVVKTCSPASSKCNSSYATFDSLGVWSLRFTDRSVDRSVTDTFSMTCKSNIRAGTELMASNLRTRISIPYLSYEYQKRRSSYSTLLLLQQQAGDGTTSHSCGSYAASEPQTDCDRTWKWQRPSRKGPLHHRAAKLNDFVSCCNAPLAMAPLIGQKMRRTYCKGRHHWQTEHSLTDPFSHTLRIPTAPGWQAARWRIVIVKLLQMFNSEGWQSV